MKWTALVFALSACFMERIFTDVVLSIAFDDRMISSTSAVLLYRPRLISLR
jgi:hypothetical protein